MTEIKRRSELLEWPSVRMPTPDLRVLLFLSAAGWVLFQVAELMLSKDGFTLKRLLEQLTGGLAGAAFGVLVAAVVFDRLKEQARREAEHRLELERKELVDIRRQLWFQEYSEPYNGLVGEIASAICGLSRILYRVFRVSPVCRALQQRGAPAYFIDYQTSDRDQLPFALASSTSPTPAGVRALQIVADEVEASSKQLGALTSVTGSSVDGADIKLIRALTSDVRDVMSEVDACVGRIWESLRDLSALHRQMLDDRPATPELSIGIGLASSIQMREAVSSWRWKLGDAERGEEFSILRADVLARGASKLARAGTNLYSHITGLSGYVEEVYIQGMGFPAAEQFLRDIAESQDDWVEGLVDRLAQQQHAGRDSIFRATAEAAEARTFCVPLKDELVSENLRD